MFHKGEISRVIYEAAGGANSPMREPITVQLGNPALGENSSPYLSEEIREYEEQVWIHDRVGDFALPDTEDTERDDSPGSAFTAFLPTGALPSGKRKFGTTVLAQWRNGRYVILRETEDGAAFNKGVPENEHSPIPIKNVDYGLIRPTDPPTGRVVVSESVHPGASNWEQLVIKISADLISTYAGALTSGQARAIKVETNPIDNTFVYTAGSAYSSTARDAETGAVDHTADFSNYPRTVDGDMKLHGWVRLYYQIATVTEQDILPAPDYGGGGGGGGASVLDDLTDVAIASPLEGHVVYYNGSSWVNRYAWDGFALEGPNAVTSVTAGNNIQLDFNAANYDPLGVYDDGTNTLTLAAGVWDLKAMLRFQFASALTSAGRVTLQINGTFSGSVISAYETMLFLPSGTPDTLAIPIQVVAGGFVGGATVFSVTVINSTDQTMNFLNTWLVGDLHRP